MGWNGIRGIKMPDCKKCGDEIERPNREDYCHDCVVMAGKIGVGLK